jgi:hypothetical protein
MTDELRQRFFQDILKRTTFDRNKVTISVGPLPARMRNEPVRRYVLDGDTLWRVVSIENDTVVCQEATNQELADMQEGMREQS